MKQSPTVMTNVSAVLTVSCFGIWTRTESSWSMSRKWPMAEGCIRADIQILCHALFISMNNIYRDCSPPFFRPKKSSSSCSSSCTASSRMLMVSTSTRGSSILERNLLAPPGVFVWLSTPKRVCSLLFTDEKWQGQTERLYFNSDTIFAITCPPTCGLCYWPPTPG